MSTIGRIFSILNVFLAAAFLGFAATNLAAHQSWKKKHDDLNASLGKELADTKQALADVTADRDAKREELDRRTQELASEQSAHTSTQQSLDNERQRALQNEGELKGIRQTLADYKTTLESMNQAREQFEAQAREAIDARYKAEDEREAALEAQRAAEQALASAQKQIADLEVALTTEKKSHQTAQTQLASLVAATGTSLDEITSQPDVRGAVVQVSHEIAPGLVSINRGSDDGVKRGMTFEIWNGNTYKGTVRVDAVRDTMCTGVIMRSVPGTSIAQGDSAATRI